MNCLHPSTIIAQEELGQLDQLDRQTLPADMRNHAHLKGDARDALERVGFVFGEIDPNDPLFIPAQFPKGWMKQASEHNMWSYLLDDQGRRRAAIFFKASSHDRRAHLKLVCRLQVETDFHDNGRPSLTRVGDQCRLVSDGPNIHHTEQGYGGVEAAEIRVAAWLDQQYPGWKSPEAHWDTTPDIANKAEVDALYAQLAELEDKEIYAVEADMGHLLPDIRAEQLPIKMEINRLSGRNIFDHDGI